MFWDLFKRKPKKKWPYPDPGPDASLEEVQDWIAGVRKRNEEMEHPVVRIGEDAQAERTAELMYRKFKRDLDTLSPKSTVYFWLKLLWFISWHAPYILKKEVEEERDKVKLPNGLTIVHTARPS